jgi:hypothetical protein
VLGEYAEFGKLRHAVKKASGDRERAIRNVYRQCKASIIPSQQTGSSFDAIPALRRIPARYGSI